MKSVFFTDCSLNLPRNVVKNILWNKIASNLLRLSGAAFLILFSVVLHAQTTSTTNGCVPFVVQFNGTGYFWDFGNGQESSEANPTTVYNAAATYTVNVYQFKNGPLVNTFDIEVYDIPTLSISANVVKGCEPLEVDFTYTLGATSIPISGANWIFGDGNSLNTVGTTASHTYTKGGDFSVSLELETGMGSCQINTVRPNFIKVIDRPNSDFSISPESSCSAPVTIALTNNSTDSRPVSYSWDFANGSTSTQESPPDQTYISEASYDIRLIATNNESCRDTATVTLNVGSPAGVIDVPDTLCLDVGTTFAYFAARNVDWDFGSDAQYYEVDSMKHVDITTSDEKSIEIFYRTGGVKTITLTTNNSGCSNMVSKDVYVQEITINPSISQVFNCINPITANYSATTDARSPSYEWTFSDQSVQNIINPSFTYYNDSDTVFYGINNEIVHNTQLIITDGVTGCYDSAFVDFTHSPVNAKVLVSGGDLAFGCAPYTISFMDSVSSNLADPITKWTWNYGDGSPADIYASSTPISHTYTTPGTYDVFLAIESSLGCTDSSYYVTVDVGQDIGASLSFIADKTTVCRGDSIELEVTSSIPGIEAFHFYADGNRLFHQQADSVVKWAFADVTGAQDVTLMVESGGCLSEITYSNYINVDGAKAEIEYENSCDTPYTYEFNSLSTSASGAINLTWDFGDGSGSSVATSPSYTYASRGDYKVLLTVQDPASGCSVHKDSVTVQVREPQAVLVAPSFACGGGEITLKATGSLDPACRGYTFRFPSFGDFQRPITWDKDSVTVAVPDVDTVGNSHMVQLIITDDNGCKDTTSTTIEPYIIDVQGIASASELCNSQTISLTDMTTSDQPLNSWSWVISNGDTLTTQSPSFTALVPPIHNDTFYISLQVEDISGCLSSEADTLLRLPYVPLDARLNVLTDSICAPDLIDFEGIDRDSKGLDFLWDFGNSTSAAGNTVTGSYTDGGFYDVKMTFSEIATGCIDSLIRRVEVQESPVAGFFTDHDLDPVLCYPQTLTFSDTSSAITSIASLFWDFDNGETSDISNYTLSYPKGTFDVSLTAQTSYGCDNTIIRTFEVDGPEATFTMDDHEICEGQEIFFEITSKADVDSLVWIFGDGADLIDFDTTTHAYVAAPSSLQTIANLLLYSDNGCFHALNDTIQFHEVTAGFDMTNAAGSIDSLMCVDEVVNLTNTSFNGDNISWDFSDGSTSVNSSPVHSYSTSGSFPITQIIENLAWGCTDTLTKVLTIVGLPKAGIEISNDTLCFGETLIANVSQPNDSSTYVWTPSSTGNMMSTVPQASFTLSLTETNYAGCISSLDSLITVIQPFAFSDWDTTIQEGKSAQLPIILDSLYNFDLTPLEGLSCLDCDYPSVSPLEDVSYSLTIDDNYGCFEDIYYLTVFVIPPSFISMPTSFTPNGDGVNDVIYVKGWYLEDLEEFKIFNRWGELIFSTKNIDEGWDGRHNGKIQKSDIYVYKIRAIGVDGNLVLKEGYLNLIN